MNVAIGYVAHMVVTRKQATAMQAREWLLQGLSMGLGRYVGGAVKARRPIHEKLGRLPELGGQKLLAAGDELTQLAQAAEARPSDAAATELLAKRKHLVDEELHALETLERHPEARLTIRDVKAALAQLRREQGALTPHGRRLALERAGLEEIVPNTEYRGSADQLARVIEAARATGVPVGPPHRTGRATRIAIGGAEIVFHEGAATPTAPAKRSPAEQFLEDVRARLDADERAKLDQIVGKRRPEDVHRQFDGDVEAAHRQVTAATARSRADAAAAVASTVKAEQIRTFVEDAGLMTQPRAREIISILVRKLADAQAKKAATSDKLKQRKQDESMVIARLNAVAALRSLVISDYMHAQVASKYPRSRVRKDVQVWKEQDRRYSSIEEFKAANKAMFQDSQKGVQLLDTPDGPRVYVEVTDIDLMVTMDQTNGKAKILHTEELKTGYGDSPKAARAQLDASAKAIASAAADDARVRLLEGGKDITDQIDLASMRTATSATRGPSNKSFQESLGLTSKSLDSLVNRMIDDSMNSTTSSKDK